MPIPLLLYSNVCCGQVEKSIRGCNPSEFRAYSKKYKSQILQKHSPLCKHGIGWWHHFVKVQSDWVDDGLDVNVIILLFSQLVILLFYLISSLIVLFCQLAINLMDISHTPLPSVNLQTQFLLVNIIEEKQFQKYSSRLAEVGQNKI